MFMKNLILILAIALSSQNVFAEKISKAQNAINKFFIENQVEVAPEVKYIMVSSRGKLSQHKFFPISSDYRKGPSGTTCILKVKEVSDESRIIDNPSKQIEITGIKKFVDSSMSELTQVQHLRYRRSRDRGDQAKVKAILLTKNSIFKSLECFQPANMGTVFTATRKSVHRIFK